MDLRLQLGEFAATKLEEEDRRKCDGVSFACTISIIHTQATLTWYALKGWHLSVRH